MKKLAIYFVLFLALFFLLDRGTDALMLRGINRYYGLDRPGRVLLLGHSHLMLSTDKERMERELSTTISKYTREGVGVNERHVMLQHFLSLPGSDSLRVCLYGVDLCTFTVGGLAQNAYTMCYPFMDNPAIDQYIRSQAPAKDYWLHRLVHTTRFADDELKNGAIRGTLSDWSNRKYGTIDIPAYRASLARSGDRHIQMDPDLIAQFRSTISLLTARGVRVILVNTPTLDLLNEWDPEPYAEIISWFHDFASRNPLVDFWDLNPQYSSRHDLFFDRIHMNADGQTVITTELINRLKPILER